MTNRKTFQVGDIVKHREIFLKSVGWYTDVPKNGKIVAIIENNHCPNIISVLWCNSSKPVSILETNIIHHHKLDPSG